VSVREVRSWSEPTAAFRVGGLAMIGLGVTIATTGRKDRRSACGRDRTAVSGAARLASISGSVGER
jgi:hypothetical protein